MNNPKDSGFSPEIHIEMWKHYDNLRQAKNGGFLTANSILVAIIGFLYLQAPEFGVIVSIVGIAINVSWLYLLNRNSDYIEYHRKIAGNGKEDFWSPESKTPRSKYLDRIPLAAFFIMWVVFLVISVARMVN